MIYKLYLWTDTIFSLPPCRNAVIAAACHAIACCHHLRSEMREPLCRRRSLPLVADFHLQTTPVALMTVTITSLPTPHHRHHCQLSSLSQGVDTIIAPSQSDYNTIAASPAPLPLPPLHRKASQAAASHRTNPTPKLVVSSS